MTTIKATCRHCGDVDLTPADVTILMREDGDWYRIRCSDCDTITERLANERMVSVLLGAGCSYTNMKSPITEAEIEEFTRKLNIL